MKKMIMSAVMAVALFATTNIAMAQDNKDAKPKTEKSCCSKDDKKKDCKKGEKKEGCTKGEKKSCCTKDKK